LIAKSKIYQSIDIPFFVKGPSLLSL